MEPHMLLAWMRMLRDLAAVAEQIWHVGQDPASAGEEGALHCLVLMRCGHSFAVRGRYPWAIQIPPRGAPALVLVGVYLTIMVVVHLMIPVAARPGVLTQSRVGRRGPSRATMGLARAYPHR